jgi:N-acetylmuramoyl-L-alanine amidase
MEAILKKYFFVLLALFTFKSFSQDLTLNVVVPDRDTVALWGNKQRIAGNTLPTAKAFINFTEVKVYGSGAFVYLYTAAKDTSTLHISVVGQNGDSLTKDIVFIKRPGLKTSPEDTVTIESVMMQPSEDIWLRAGDILEVKMKGSPNKHPEFSIDGVASNLPMRELDPKNTGGLGGIYIGRYVIKEDDECSAVAIKFHITKGWFNSEEAYSKGKVSIIRDSLPRAAEVTGKRPFMNYGLGSDRLGGAKFGFLVDGVKVIVTGKTGDQYRVKLSEGLEAWIPEDYIKLLPIDTPLPTSLTGSMSITGNDSDDVVRVAVGQKLPFSSEQQLSPTALVVNIFGATSNTNWITHYLSSDGIQQVKCSQVATDQFQITIFLKYHQHWGHDISYENGAMKIKIRRPPVIADTVHPLANMLIAIDAGHGIGSQGAIGSTGAIEKDINLAIAKELQAQLLEKGARTVMTRETDANVLMGDRADIAVNSGARILVSIHNNSTGDASDAEQIKGTSTYYRYPGFKPLADIMYKHLLTLGLNEWGVTGAFNFSLSGPTQLPNVLCEVAFMSNPDDEMKLIDPEFRKRAAGEIIEGLEEFVKKYKR